ncbi:uncharacterized protein LOC128285409 [Gossypium arboreum]|uniref:uncharacterized protein LOC128285409 n=1 Tax=Gossypium arboreum TaxID=29729 RepID=UPI0022F14745|nr:uncharacterized protein LOC128285409 [Gossypium arboreum]
MSQATSSLTPVMDPYGIPQAVKVLDSKAEEVLEAIENSSGDESDYESEKKEILQHMEYFNRLFVVASSSMQLYYEKYILKQPCMDSKQSGKYYLVNSGYPQMKGYLRPYRDFMEYEDINRAYENIIDSENTHGRKSDNDDDNDDDRDDDESNNSSGFEMELTRDAIASSLMNSL